MPAIGCCLVRDLDDLSALFFLASLLSVEFRAIDASTTDFGFLSMSESGGLSECRFETWGEGTFRSNFSILGGGGKSGPMPRRSLRVLLVFTMKFEGAD